MFVCNEERQKRYLKERREQEINDDRQQDVIDEMNAERLGFERSATQLSRLGKRVFTDLIENTTTPTEKKVVDILKNTFNTPAEIKKSNPTLIDFIKAGTLSQLFDKIKQINPKTLSKKSKIIQTDLINDPIVKEVMNETIDKIILDSSISEEDKPAEIEKAIIEIAAGGDKKPIKELVNKARSLSEGSISSNASTRKIDDFDGKSVSSAKSNNSKFMQLVNALSSRLQNNLDANSELTQKRLTKVEMKKEIDELSKYLPKIKKKMEKYEDSNVETYRVALERLLTKVQDLAQ